MDYGNLRLVSVCGKTPFYDGFKPRDGIRRSGGHVVDLGDVRRVIRPSGAPKVRMMFSCSLSGRAESVPRGGMDGY